MKVMHIHFWGLTLIASTACGSGNVGKYSHSISSGGGTGGAVVAGNAGVGGGAGGTTSTTEDAGKDAAPEQDGDIPCNRTIDPDQGIFVVPTPTADAGAPAGVNCGTLDNPCNSINNGVAQAHGLGRKVVYVAKGTYVETVTLKAAVRVEGAWNVTGTKWTASCGASVSNDVIIQGPSQGIVVDDRGTTSTTDDIKVSAAVLADSLGGAAQLAYLTVQSKKTPAQGESLYGIFARGTTTDLTLDQVNVTAYAGGAGKKGDPGEKGSDGNPAGCSPGSNRTAIPQSGVGNGARHGTFSKNGYAPSSGDTGPSGAEFGDSGPPPAEGVAAMIGQCVYHGTCERDSTCSSTKSCGTDGLAGCGSGPGYGGHGGDGGGSSLALFSWDATVTVIGGALTSSNGGLGGKGGDPGLPGTPSNEVAGVQSVEEQVTCTTYQSSTPGPQMPATYACDIGDATGKHGAGGLPGGKGLSGSKGGNGGSGSGGSSFPIYEGGAADVEYSPTTALVPGEPGGSDNGDPGDASKVGPIS